MLQIADLTYRIAGRTLIDGASATLAGGWKVGLIGRNGTGKSTLLRLIRDEAGQNEAIRLPKSARMGSVAQEIAPTADKLLDVVLAADKERAALLAEAETAEDPDRIAEIHMRLVDIEAHSAEARAAEILVGLGFSQADLSRASSEFSGGWRMRAALAGVLFSTPDLLLLDEPTNYLDLEGAAWLEAYIRRYPNTVIIVSHDRALLNRAVTHIMALEQGKLIVQPGGYDAYIRRRAEQAALQTAAKAKQDAERARLQAFVDRFRAKASKAAQAQSRVKMLEKMQEIAIPLAERTTPFKFSNPDPMASPLLSLEHAELGYIAGKPVLRDVSLQLDQDDRIGVIGPNGQGKTTLVKSIAARIALLGGKRHAVKAVKIGYFSQDQLDELRPGETPLEHVRDLIPDTPVAKQRALAAQMGFGHEKIDTKVESLSGGEKVRLLLGLTTFHRPHILILDEPTSHLDIDSREALIEALNDYAGAVILITHDVYLAEACVERLWLVHNGRMRPYDGDLNDYRSLVLNADRPDGKKADAKASGQKREGGEKRPALGALKKRIEAAEKRMAQLNDEINAMDDQLADPAFFARDPGGAAGVLRRRGEAVKALAAAEEEWIAASEAHESQSGGRAP